MKLAAPVRIKITVWGLAACFFAAIVAAAASLVWSARLTALANSEAQVTRFVAGAETALNQALLGIDVSLAGMDDLLGLSASQPEWLDPSATSQILRNAARQNLMLRFVALLDDQAHVMASSDAAGEKLTLELPDGFLDEALAPGVSTLVVSAPTVSFASSERVIFLARHFRVGNGAKLIAVAQVPVDMLSALLMQGVEMPGLEVTLERGQGQLLLGVPSQDARSNPNLSPPLGELNATEDSWNTPARLSAKPALVVTRPMLYQTIWISASLPLDSALSDWRTLRNAAVGTTLLFGLMFLAAGSFAMVYLNRIATARRAMTQSKATLDQALASMVGGFLLLDAQRRVVRWNRRYEEIFPWLVGTITPLVPFRQMIEATAKFEAPASSEGEQRSWVDQRMELRLNSLEPHERELPNGDIIQITERATPDGGLVITYHDVTALRRASAEIETLAFFDPLTGLPNRRLLIDRLGQATASAGRSGQIGAVLFLDLDQFKTLNDTLGHEVGDQLLQQVAQRLKACVREADTVARLGGDEFVVMLKDLSEQSQQAAALAQLIGEKILFSLNQPYTLGVHHHRSACSIGATLFGYAVQSAAELLKQADIAMYQVKAQRGNALCFFDPQMQVIISARAQLEADLRTALALDQFELHYQPQFTLAGRMMGAEVLLRWRHPERGMVSPGEFITVAEERELIIPIGQWVLHTACQQLAAWQGDARFCDLHLSVNVSARQFRQPDFVKQVLEAIGSAGVQARLLKLELTESLVLDNVDDCIAKMDLLKARGVGFSVDDFGTGYSSLAYLTRLPLDQLKIDQSFVRHLGVRHTDGVIVQTIIGMARNLGLEVIAEGVETIAQKDLLAAFGCELYQGYLFARPAPVAALEALVDADPLVVS